jgi:hypothetical protein
MEKVIEPINFLWCCFGLCVLSICISISMPFTDLSFRSTFKDHHVEVPFLEEYNDKKSQMLIILFLIIFSVFHLFTVFVTSFGLRMFPISVDLLHLWTQPNKDSFLQMGFITNIIRALFMPLIGNLLDQEHEVFVDVDVKYFHKLIAKLPLHFRLCRGI